MGEAYIPVSDGWEKRLDAVKEAMRNAVLNGARKSLKSRPLYIRGKLLFSESPRIYITSGQWRAVIRAHLVINEVKYMDVH